MDKFHSLSSFSLLYHNRPFFSSVSQKKEAVLRTKFITIFVLDYVNKKKNLVTISGNKTVKEETEVKENKEQADK